MRYFAVPITKDWLRNMDKEKGLRMQRIYDWTRLVIVLSFILFSILAILWG